MNSFDSEKFARQISPAVQKMLTDLYDTRFDAMSNALQALPEPLLALREQFFSTHLPLAQQLLSEYQPLAQKLVSGYQIMAQQLADTIQASTSLPDSIDYDRIAIALEQINRFGSHTKSSDNSCEACLQTDDTTLSANDQSSKKDATINYILSLIAILISVLSMIQTQALSDANTELLKEQHQEEMAMRQKELDAQIEELEVSKESMELLKEVLAILSLQEDDSANSDDLPEFPPEVQVPDYNLPLNQTPLNQIPEDNQ